MRCIHCSHERRRGRLHQLPGERIDVPADVQLGVHCIRDKLVLLGHVDRRDMLCEIVRRVCSSHEWGCGRLHQLAGERVNLSTDVQLGVHGIGDELMLLGHVDSCDVLSELVHCLLTFDQGWDRRKLLLHQWRHCWWNHGVMHLHFM